MCDGHFDRHTMTGAVLPLALQNREEVKRPGRLPTYHPAALRVCGGQCDCCIATYQCHAQCCLTASHDSIGGDD